jgi:hypothetical protein
MARKAHEFGFRLWSDTELNNVGNRYLEVLGLAASHGVNNCMVSYRSSHSIELSERSRNWI